MNGWDEGHPSWWLNLEAHPDAVVRLAGQPPRPVRAIRVAGQERDRLWQLWVGVEPKLDGYARQRSTETPVIVLEPRDRLAPTETTNVVGSSDTAAERTAHPRWIGFVIIIGAVVLTLTVLPTVRRRMRRFMGA
jgi:hypothetical protein